MRNTRGLALILVLAFLLLAACIPRSSEPIDADGTGPGTALVHWQQNVPASLERQIEVIVPASVASNGLFMRAVNVGMQQANRSPYINTVLNVPQTLPASGCLSLSHCVTIQRKVMNGGSTGFGWGAGGHMFGRAASIWIDSNPWNQAVLENALCHELFHALGLQHSFIAGVQGPCQNAVATAVDLDNVKRSTAHFDVVFAGPMVQAQAPVKITKQHSTTRAQYEKMAKEAA